MARRTLLLLASILVAALGTALIWLYVQGADQRARQGASLVTVLFLAQDAEPGVEAQSLKTVPQQIPAGTVPDAVTTRQELAGQRLTIEAFAGQVLLRRMLGATTAQASRFPQGGAVAISIVDANRVPADLQPGDLVDVYALDRNGGSPKALVTAIRVRTIGNQAQPGTGGTGTNAGATSGTVPPTIVGFDATRDQASKLYGMVAAGQQPALYDTGTRPPASSG
jgi:pilus assembly protein CpaB